MNRIKLNEPVIQSRAEMEALVGEIVALQLELNKSTVQMDQEITKVRERYEDRLDRLKKRVDEKTTVAQVWSDSNPDEFGVKKSIDFVHAVVGFRTGNPTVKPLKKSFTVAVIVERLKRSIWGQLYIRQPDPVVDKEALIADRKSLGAEKLAEVGIKIDQAESFYIEPKTTELAGAIKEVA